MLRPPHVLEIILVDELSDVSELERERSVAIHILSGFLEPDRPVLHRKRALTTLRLLGAVEAIEEVRASTSDEIDVVACEAMRTLRVVGGPGDIDFFTSALDHASACVRLEAVRALGVHGTRDHLRLLASALAREGIGHARPAPATRIRFAIAKAVRDIQRRERAA